MTGLWIPLAVIVGWLVLSALCVALIAGAERAGRWAVARIWRRPELPAPARLHRMSPVVALTMARYAPFWTDQLAEAIVARQDAATERPFNSIAYLLAQNHVAALSRIIVALEQP